ncbi:nucleotide sugar dehydrogenase [Halorubrum amylolyticum]|uniref:nucleotide sugar dehydrogenase n=1 Tax=Halorubrum amylolyticum TaxID=2508724 RepID=UPI001008ECD2|nr:nucleotide sugar dehydrogenase [Halorubrum amylolyticum]
MSKQDVKTSSEVDVERSTETVGVAGLGYVGLSVAVAFDRTGWDVVGYDISESTIDRLRNGNPSSNVISERELSDLNIHFTTDPGFVSDTDFVIIAVPTPTDDRETPNLDYVKSAGETIGENLSPGTTVVLESTVFPGATREVLIPALERTSGFTAGEEFDVGYSPERISPGDQNRGIKDVIKVVSGQNREVRERIRRLYSNVIDAGVRTAPSIEVAEMMKVFENVQRDVNIALVNELAVACEHLGLNTDEVLEAAGTKWNFHEYSPGLVGGHCIPVDPAHYAHSTEVAGFTPQIVNTARDMNEFMTKFVTELTIRGLNDCGKVPKESRLLVFGLSYKANVDDVRNTKVNDLISELQRYDISIAGYDPQVDDELLRSKFDIPICEEVSFDGVDGLIFTTGHDEFQSLSLEDAHSKMNEAPLLVDIEDMFDAENAERCGFAYKQL